MTVWTLGSLSAKYECGGRGPGTVSTGNGDAGGVSYGRYQLASRLGRPEDFLAHEGARWAVQFQGMRSGAPAFTRVWTAIAAREPAAFGAAQHDYVRRTHYDVQIAHIRRMTGDDPDRCSPAVRDAIWSAAVQHGPMNDLVVDVLKRGPHDDRALLHALYAERGRRGPAGQLVHFGGSSPAVQAGIARRFRDELRDALAMLDTCPA